MGAGSGAAIITALRNMPSLTMLEYVLNFSPCLVERALRRPARQSARSVPLSTLPNFLRCEAVQFWAIRNRCHRYCCVSLYGSLSNDGLDASGGVAIASVLPRLPSLTSLKYVVCFMSTRMHSFALLARSSFLVSCKSCSTLRGLQCCAYRSRDGLCLVHAALSSLSLPR